jgi:hypothetical protein
LKPDGSEDRESPQARGADEFRSGPGISPGNVARRIFGSDSGKSASLESDRYEVAKAQRKIITAAGLLRVLTYPGNIDAKGTEHVVRFRGVHVEKHQHSDGWVPVLDKTGKLAIRSALPSEYLRRLHLQNELFGDAIEIIGLTRADRFAISQPTLRGGEPSENEIRDVLLHGGWRRVPTHLQNLPAQLMGSAWWHEDEELVILDARKPNFKKTDFGTLPIDLILADLTPEMSALFSEPIS